MATCSSDRTINIFEVNAPNQQRLIQELKAHEGPVWRVAWGPGKWSNVLASCSYDGKVCLWKEQNGKYVLLKDHMAHQGSVNDISWADDETGFFLACGSSDGKISILHWDNGEWNTFIFDAHLVGCNSVAWRPSNDSTKDIHSLILASGGCDNLVRLWKFVDGEWIEAQDPLLAHSDWIRDLSWAPNNGLSYTRLASCAQDKQVCVWSFDQTDRPASKSMLNNGFPEIVWKVDWSPTGLLLMVSYGDNHGSVWKQVREEEWAVVHSFD